MNRARYLLQSTLLVIIFLGLGKVTGFVRLLLVSQAYGTGREADAFTSANQLPEVFIVLIAGGALAAAFIPVYSQYLTSDRQREAAQLANTIITLVICLLGTIALLGAIFAPWLTRTIMVPDYDPELQTLTASLMRVILIQTVLFGVSGVLSSILNANQHFALPALAPIALDIGYLVGLFALTPTMGIHGLAWGTVLGGLLHILIQLPGLRRYRFRYRPDARLVRFGLAEIGRQIRHFGQRLELGGSGRTVEGGVREIIYLMGPRIVMLSAIQAADIFVLRFGSGLAEGAVTSYFYGFTIMQLPETLLGTAIAIVVFPTMAELFNEQRLAEMKALAITALRIIWVLTVPAAIALLIVGRPAIQLFLERGAFTALSTELVYATVAIFSLRIVAEATVEIVARLFYARHNTRTPMITYIVWFTLNVLLLYLLVPLLGIRGMALASTAAFTVLAVLLYWLNRRELGSLSNGELVRTAIRALAAAAGMAAAIWLLGRLLGSGLLFLLVAVPAGLVIYFALNHLLGGREIPELLSLVRQRRSA